MALQGPLEVIQGLLLLIQVVVGIAHAEIPAVILPKSVPVEFQQSNGPLKQRAALWGARVSLIVVGPGQFQVLLRGALLRRNRLQEADDCLIIFLSMQEFTLSQQIHRGASSYSAICGLPMQVLFPCVTTSIIYRALGFKPIFRPFSPDSLCLSGAPVL